MDDAVRWSAPAPLRLRRRCSTQPREDAAGRLVERAFGLDALRIEIDLRGDAEDERDDHRREARRIEEVEVALVEQAERALAVDLVEARVGLARFRIRAEPAPEGEQDD